MKNDNNCKQLSCMSLRWKNWKKKLKRDSISIFHNSRYFEDPEGQEIKVVMANMVPSGNSDSDIISLIQVFDLINPRVKILLDNQILT